MMEQTYPLETAEPIVKHRILSVDILRGFIMVLMALDHANMLLSGGSTGEFWHAEPPFFSTSAAFWTRFTTHICAPGFFFLMGIGMVYFYQSRLDDGWSSQKINRIFMKRGLLIILIHFLLSFLFALPNILQGQMRIVFDVLYILGMSMIAAAWFLNKPVRLTAAVALISLFIPELVLSRLNGFPAGMNLFFRIMAIPGPIGQSIIYYTFFPWFGLTIAGIIAGKGMQASRKKIFAALPLLSAATMALFVMLRAGGGFGNMQVNEHLSQAAFFQLTKYPASLSFILFMLSINLFLLFVIEHLPLYRLQQNALLVFGRNPLFFYMLHYMVFIVMMLSGLNNLPLAVMFPFWILGLLICYPCCRMYHTFKREKPADSIWRML